MIIMDEGDCDIKTIWSWWPMTMVIVMMINDHADGEDHDKTPFICEYLL